MNASKIVLLYFFLVTVSFAQAPEITTGNKLLVFGSQKILDEIWTSEQLKGNLSDKKIRRLSSPDLKPPETLKFVMNTPLDKELRNSIRSVIPFDNFKIIALTFDLCEKADEVTGYDADIVNILRGEKVKATFFAGGKWMRSHEEQTMQLMADPLFELGNHGWTHGNLAKLSHNKIVEQILWTQAQYELIWEKLQKKVLARGLGSNEMDKIPQSLTLFRPPYGRCSSDALDTLAEYGLASIQWNIVSGDPARSQTPQGIAHTVLHQIKSGSIVIFHANGRGYATAKALPMIIDGLRAKGYKFVTVSELLKLGEIESFKDCFEVKPNDNGKYDRIFAAIPALMHRRQ